MKWLKIWEADYKAKRISSAEFLPPETAEGLRATITSTLQLCKYLIEKYDFKYLLTGRVNQANLEVLFKYIL